MLRSILPVVLLCCTFAWPAAQASQTTAWVANRDATLQRVKRVGMLPVSDAAGLGRPEALQTMERLVREQLQSAGFTVIGPDAYAAIRARVLKQLGGIYDAKTGVLDEDDARALAVQARRSFIEEHQLDATLTTEIQVHKADVTRDVANWDGVSDRSTGPTGLLKKILAPGGPSVKGNVSALSVVLALFGARGDPLYTYPGGIELLAYVAPSEFGGFRYVPADALLRDEPRMKRAAEAATLFLRKSQAQIDAEQKAAKEGGVERPRPEPLPQQPEAPGADEIEPFKQPRDAFLAGVKRVVIAPLTIEEEVPDETATRQRYEVLLTEALVKLGWQVVPSARYVQLLLAERDRDASVSFDVYTGAKLGDSLQALRERVLTQLADGDQPVDAIIHADIVRTTAPHQGEDAKWDGVQQNAIDLGPWKKRYFFQAGELAEFGRMPALSLRVLIASRNGEVLFLNHGGIQLLEQMAGMDLDPIPKAWLLRIPEHDVEAVRVALRPLVLTPEQLDAELNPRGAKKKQRAHKPN